MKMQNMKIVQKWREYAGPKDERLEAENAKIYTFGFILLSFGMLALTIYLYTKGGIGFEGVLTCTIAMMGSFGPVVALSSLSNK